MGCCGLKEQYRPEAKPCYIQENPSQPQKSIFKAFFATSTGATPSEAQWKQLQEATKLFSQDQFAEAASIYRNYLQWHGNEVPDKIDGLGQTLISLGYFQWHLYRHYKEGIQKKQYVGTIYDALSLCYQALKSKNEDAFEEGVQWYKDMVDDYPENYAVVMGYANILCNGNNFDEAIDYYERVAEMRPAWVRPIECMAYIYQYKRVRKAKSKELASKLLEMEPNSRVGLFVSGRNQPTPEKKIEVLTQVTVHHPYYGRAFNEIGIVYGGTLKKYQQAIDWYARASEVCPQYASCYNNVGVNLELMKRYEEAIDWYFRAIQKDAEYKAPHKNLIDVYKALKYSDEQIAELVRKYNLKADYYYYYTGLGYYDNKEYRKSIELFNKTYGCIETLGKAMEKIYNSHGISHDDLRENDKALDMYRKAIEANPKYHSAYYNAAIVYKRMSKLEEAKEWYRKAIKANHRYSYAFNNLGNIYKNEANYQEAIKNYKQAIKYNSTYTLALANMGVCYLKIDNFREAFNALERAKECLPTDNNNLNQGNKDFLKTTLSNFDKEGETWRQNGCITPEQKKKLKSLINNFEKTFKSMYSDQEKQPVSRDKVLKPAILDIVSLVAEDQFSLANIDKVYDLIEILFHDNEEYFHILPQLFMQYFYDNVLIKHRPVLEVENELKTITKRLSDHTVSSLPADEEPKKKSQRSGTIKMAHFNPPSSNKVNLFKNAKYFNSYEQIYSEIISVNEETKKSYVDYKSMVDTVRKASYGELYGIGMKLPVDERFQFKVILRIFEKMFKQELTAERVQALIAKIEKNLEKRKKAKTSQLQVGEVVSVVMTTWTEQITEIVRKRKADKKETKCEVSDLLRAKIMYNSLDHLKRAIEAVDAYCMEKGYQVIQMDNRLAKKTTQDVVFKVKIKEAVCQLQLGLKQDDSLYHWTHCIYQIERSPLGCIFGSYVFMSKGFEYPFHENCRDIVEHLKGSKEEKDQKIVQAAQYIVDRLTLKATN